MTIKRHMKLVSSELDEAQSDNAGHPALLVALASSDRKQVDEHFGAASQLVVYRVDEHNSQLVGVCEFSDAKQDGNDNKLAEKIEALDGVHAVVAMAVGASAVRKLTANGTQPIKLSEPAEIGEVLYQLRQEIRADQTPWIRKALQPESASSDQRMESLLDEAWDE